MTKPEAFDAAGYVGMWRRYKNIITIAHGLGGREAINIHFPDDSEWPPMSELELYKTGKQHDPSWQQAVIDYLRAEQEREKRCP